MPDAVTAARDVYKLRRPQASPLLRLVSDHLHRLQIVYDERFARGYGPWYPVVAQVAEKFLACGVLEHGVARIRYDACAHEFLLAFSCKCRFFFPSYPAQRLAIWTQWLDTTLLKLVTPTPQSRTGTFGERGRPTGASDRSLRRPGAFGKQRPDGRRGATAGGG